MATINFDLIISKADDYFGSSAGVKKKHKVMSDIISGKVKKVSDGTGDSTYDPDGAAEKFIEVLHKTIMRHADHPYLDEDGYWISKVRDGFLGPTAIKAMQDINYTSPVPYDDNLFSMSVYFEGNLSRKSLNPAHYPRGVDNIIALLNSGYTAGGQVRGIWEGHGEIWSLNFRMGRMFLQEARDDFMGNYASQYGVVDVVLTGEYAAPNDRMTITKT